MICARLCTLAVKIEQKLKEDVRHLELSRGEIARKRCRIGAQLQTVDEEMKVCNLVRH